MEVQAFRSDAVVLAIKADGSRHKILQIRFGRDGSLFVTFPYFAHAQGILSVATLAAGSPTTDINLAQSGKVASHLVKYSHHPDGRAHFSQDGKVKTEIKKQSVALSEQRGHVFTVLVQGLSAFEVANEVKDTGTSPKRTTLTFDVLDHGAPAFRIVGRWYWIEDLQADPRPPRLGPVVVTERPDGIMQRAFIVANPKPETQHVLLLTCEPEKEKISQDGDLMVFYGGFDPPDVMSDTRQVGSFLAFIYPAENFEALKMSIGCVDYFQTPPFSRPQE